jgi:hypothetical protein
MESMLLPQQCLLQNWKESADWGHGLSGRGLDALCSILNSENKKGKRKYCWGFLYGMME